MRMGGGEGEGERVKYQRERVEKRLKWSRRLILVNSLDENG
jgi:hypothetical protein